MLSLQPASPGRISQPDVTCYTNTMDVPYFVGPTETTNYYRFDYPKTITRGGCGCSPRCAIVAGTIGGVQTVVIKAGANPRNCPINADVTFTGPGGFQSTTTAVRAYRKFSPAADGTWTVTSSICGVTNTCTITLP